MQYWPFWMSGLALSVVIVGQWLWTRRLMAVSGRFTALVDGATSRVGLDRATSLSSPSPPPAPSGPPGPPAPTDALPDNEPMSDEDLLEALRLATQAEFGEAGVEAAPERDPKVSLGIVRPQTPGQHVAFLASLALGGTLAALLAGSFEPSAPLSAPGFLRRFGEGLPAYLVLILGGVLVGFGTRMSGGCTSGHGLCGVSRFQPGSAVATACFFGMGILASFAIGALT